MQSGILSFRGVRVGAWVGTPHTSARRGNMRAVRSTERVRHQLEQDRRAGLPFGAAWSNALEALPLAEREEWGAVLEDTRAAWATAYTGTPALRAQRALSAIGTDPERDVPIGEPDAWEPMCPFCRGPMPAKRDGRVRYCSRVCQRAAHGRRVAA